MITIDDLASRLRHHLPGPGQRQLPAAGLQLWRSRDGHDALGAWQEPALVAILQGGKRGMLGGQRFAVQAGEMLVVHLPMLMLCEAARLDDPDVLGVSIALDEPLVAELVQAATDAGFGPAPTGPLQAVAPLTEADRTTLARLIQLADEPLAQPVLGPALRREWLFRALCSPAGPLLRTLVAEHGDSRVVWNVVQGMRARLADTPDMVSLARAHAMSPSRFYARFRAQTGASPLQYLKRLRLQRAQQMIQHQGSGVAEAAYAVGYASASQFSREYRRAFGVPPGREAAGSGRRSGDLPAT